MNILILEDDPQRINIFVRHLERGNVVTVTDQVDEAIMLLKTQTFDVAYLDHDLGGKVFVDPEDEPTGYHVAKWIAENLDRKPEAVFVHSHNASRAQDMADMIPEAYYAPFPKCLTDFKITQ